MNSEEIFPFFSEPDGEIKIGQWVKFLNLENVLSEIRMIDENIEAEEQAIDVATSNIKAERAKISGMLESGIKLF